METDLKNERYVFYLNCSVYHNLQSQNYFTKWLFTYLELCLVVIKFIKFFLQLKFAICKSSKSGVCICSDEGQSIE
jgi:hypothetical protein